ncbi:calcium-binding protein [Nocardioides stalactiti]|uniref:calcium-binding protein n=1 Tax=Nocardioides stalactiti TaxID=2755356 RepID=UPI001FE61BC9|nr:calcium-binding protein [Nocardioides stalactiti]
MLSTTARTTFIAAVLAASAVVAGPAHATPFSAEITVSGGILTVQGNSVVLSTIELAETPTAVTVYSISGISNPGGGCTEIDVFNWTCPKAGLTSYRLLGGPNNDNLSAATLTIPGEIEGQQGDDTLKGGRAGDDISGGEGVDTTSYFGRAAQVIVTLDDTAVDGGGDEFDNVRSDVESVVGGSGDDWFEGDASAESFYGGGGDDRFYPSAGAGDVFQGGDGVDEMRYPVNYTAPLNLSLDATANDGPAGQNDNLLDLEVLRGGVGADTLTGDGDDNVLLGNSGKDVLVGAGGADILYTTGVMSTMDGGSGDDTLHAWAGTGKQLIGGPGTDLVSYEGYSDADGFVLSQAPVVVSINGAADDGSAGQKDNVRTDVENVAGTRFADKLTGSTGANALHGLGGNDTLNGAGGADVLLPQRVSGIGSDNDVVSGGAGTDLVSYATETDDLDVSIDNQADDGKLGELDNVKSDVEQVQGGSGDDSLAGGGAANLLLGGDGADVLRGLGGVDTLDGQGGADLMSGGTGIDTVTYADRTADLQVTLDNLDGDGESTEDDNVQTDVEVIIAGSGNDDLFGSSLANKIFGGAGHDQVVGGAGNDVIDLGNGDDGVRAGVAKDGADKIYGGPGVDTVDYGQRTGALKVTINGSAGDGESGENDLVATDVETLIGGSGNDLLTGGASDNTLVGNDGDDVLTGGTGADWLDPGYGSDEMIGGTGSDTVDYGDRTADVFLSVDDLALDGETDEKDQIRLDIENLVAGSGDDFVIANHLDSTVHGGAGEDNIFGGHGNDNLYGEGGNDLIEGEGDTDFVDGGSGPHDRCLTAESTVNCEHFS